MICLIWISIMLFKDYTENLERLWCEHLCNLERQKLVLLGQSRLPSLLFWLLAFTFCSRLTPLELLLSLVFTLTSLFLVYIKEGIHKKDKKFAHNVKGFAKNLVMRGIESPYLILRSVASQRTSQV